MTKGRSKKDDVPRYESEQTTEGASSRNAILDRYGLAASSGAADSSEQEMLTWEAAQEGKLAAEAEAQQALQAGTRLHPSKVVLSALAHNPYNPREELTNLDETAGSLKERGQLQPLAVVTRAAFLGAHPDQASVLGEVTYVVIDGNRRLAAAALAGLDELRIDVNDSLAATAADVLESALIANVHREDVAPLDQAHAIQQLVDTHGQQKTVAARLGKSAAWVSQRLALLNLAEDLQEKVGGELTVKDARRIGGLPAEQQREEATKAVNRVKSPRKPRRAAVPQKAAAPAPADPAVPAQQTAGMGGSDRVNPVNREQTANLSTTDEAGSAQAATDPLDAFDWDSPFWFDQQLRKRMSTENRGKLVYLLQGDADDGAD